MCLHTLHCDTLHHNSWVVFEPTYPSVDMGAFVQTDWKSMYGDVEEMIPPDAPVRLNCAYLLTLTMLVNNSQGVQELDM
jgi:hypothetical protein